MADDQAKNNNVSAQKDAKPELLTDVLVGDPEVIALIEKIRAEREVFVQATDQSIHELDDMVNDEVEQIHKWEDDADEQVSAYVQDLVSEDAALPDIAE
ncbi:MAG: hypothetical protein M3Q73_00905 [bacterium]|nr:hypothetical protein [bacterium]